MSRKPLFWLDKVIKRNGDVGRLLTDDDIKFTQTTATVGLWFSYNNFLTTINMSDALYSTIKTTVLFRANRPNGRYLIGCFVKIEASWYPGIITIENDGTIKCYYQTSLGGELIEVPNNARIYGSCTYVNK